MRVSLLGPTNLKKFASIIEKDEADIAQLAKDLGTSLAKQNCQLHVVFNLSGMLKLVADAYKAAGGKLTMLYTENDYDWETKPYLSNLQEGDKTVKYPSWHDMLLSLVTDSDIVICAGLSAGVMAELGYMKWNYQEKKGKVKWLIGIKEFLRDGQFPPEIGMDMSNLVKICSVEKLHESIEGNKML